MLVNCLNSRLSSMCKTRTFNHIFRFFEEMTDKGMSCVVLRSMLDLEFFQALLPNTLRKVMVILYKIYSMTLMRNR